MSSISFSPGPQYVLNFCTKYLARYNTDARHAFTDEAKGTLSRTIAEAWRFPKYGGNSAGSGWAYLAERYTDPQSGNSLFQWRDAVEKPLGSSADYLG